jgi:hypothetical protein
VWRGDFAFTDHPAGPTGLTGRYQRTLPGFLRDLGTKEKVSPEGPINWGTTANDFVAGKAAMMYYTRFARLHVEDGAPEPQGDHGLEPVLDMSQ